jgi:hypothetical protein
VTGGAFISYRRGDAAGFAGRLCDSLERHLPTEQIFRDVDGLAPGQDFVAAIETRLRQCRVCLAVIGRDWLNVRDAEGRRRLDQPDDFVRLELIAALARPEVLTVPVLVEGATMPPADALPQEIRALARRQAVSLRDDTWDSDVERLVRSLGPAVGEPRRLAPPRVPFRVDWRVAASVVGLIVLALVIGALRSDESGTGADPAPVDGVPVSDPAPGIESAAPVPAPASGGRELAIPAVSQVGSRGLIYTLMSARLEPGASSDTLRLRVALENESDGAANFWDNTFRLVVEGDVLSPNSHLNVLVDGHATSEGTVTFSVPSGTKRGVLRITILDTAGEIPLDFSGRAGTPAPSPSRSARAIVTSISTEARTLVTTPAMSATLTGVGTRRFANVLRVDLALRMAASGPGAVGTGDLTLRLVVGEDMLAPTKFPIGGLIEGGTTLRTTAEFEVPTATTRAVLRATAGEARSEVPLTLR